MNRKIKAISRYAIISALIVVAYAIDAFISMAGLPIRIAVVTLIIVLTVIAQFDLFTAIFTGLVFGLTSFIFAWTAPNITSEAFRNPLVSIMPRMILGFTSYVTFKGLKKAVRNSSSKFVANIIPRAIAGAVGVITNTVLVMAMIALFGGSDIIATVIQIVVSINFIIELGCGLFIVPTVSYAIEKPLKKIRA